MIQLQDLKDLTGENIFEVLQKEEQPFEIYIPKSTQQFFSERSDIASDYGYLAYAGNLLREISTSFEYEFVSPVMHESILFKISCNDLNELANTLLFVSYYDINTPPEGEEILFWDLIDGYLDEVGANQVDAACPDFIEVCKEFNKEEKDDDEIEED